VAEAMKKPERSHYNRFWNLDKDIVFLNHGSFGATPTFVLEEQRKWVRLMEKDPIHFFEHGALEPHLQAKRAVAKMVGCDASDLALLENATTGVNTILRSLTFKQGDEILVPDHAYKACRNAIDFVANRWGATVVTFRIPFPLQSEEEVLTSMRKAVTNRTVFAMIDSVTSPTALRLPFETMVAELEGQGIEVLLDAAHGIGMIPLNLSELGASYVTSNCHKWLCAPKGAAFLYVRKNKQENIHPLTISHGHTVPEGVKSRFELEFDWTGTRDLSALLSLPLVIDGMAHLHEGGWNGIMKHNHDLVVEARAMLLEGLGIEAPCPESMLGSIATLPLPHDDEINIFAPDPLHTRLRKQYGIQIPVMQWDSPKGRFVRISAQLYNSIEEYAYLLECLKIELGL
jgi:isopenicillin-N epimerase